MKNLLLVLAGLSLFSTVSMAAMTFTCSNPSNNPVQLTVASTNLVTLETSYAKGGLSLVGISAGQTYSKFAGYMGGKESKMEFPSTVLVSNTLINCHVIPHGFSIGSIIIQGTNGQPQTFNCR